MVISEERFVEATLTLWCKQRVGCSHRILEVWLHSLINGQFLTSPTTLFIIIRKLNSLLVPECKETRWFEVRIHVTEQVVFTGVQWCTSPCKQDLVNIGKSRPSKLKPNTHIFTKKLLLTHSPKGPMGSLQSSFDVLAFGGYLSIWQAASVAFRFLSTSSAVHSHWEFSTGWLPAPIDRSHP